MAIYENLQKNIKERLKERSLSINALEKRAGLRQSTVHNIVYGRSKSPTINILNAIAKEFQCSIQDLIGEKKENFPTSSPTLLTTPIEDKIPWDAELFIECVQVVQSLLQEYKVKATKDPILTCINEVYVYSIGQETKKVDTRFADWLVERSFLTS